MIEVQLPKSADPHAVFSAFSADPPRHLSDSPIGRVLFGRWNREEVVLVRVSECVWEVQCHGGSAACNRILNDLRAVGFETDKASESLSGNAVEDRIRQVLLNCRTRVTASLALAQADGRLQQLLDDAASEDPVRRTVAAETTARWRNAARHLTTPWRIGLIGPPNAGKSSLLNALAGMHRAIVSEIPGTTRDQIEVETFVDGWPILLIDTAGIRDTAASDIEHQGIRRSLQVVRNCDLIAVVLDVTNPGAFASIPSELTTAAKTPVCILFSKCDLLPTDGKLPDVCSAMQNPLSRFPRFLVSALRRQGIDSFLRWALDQLLPERPDLNTTLPLHLHHGERA